MHTVQASLCAACKKHLSSSHSHALASGIRHFDFSVASTWAINFVGVYILGFPDNDNFQTVTFSVLEMQKYEKLTVKRVFCMMPLKLKHLSVHQQGDEALESALLVDSTFQRQLKDKYEI